MRGKVHSVSLSVARASWLWDIALVARDQLPARPSDQLTRSDEHLQIMTPIGAGFVPSSVFSTVAFLKHASHSDLNDYSKSLGSVRRHWNCTGAAVVSSSMTILLSILNSK